MERGDTGLGRDAYGLPGRRRLDQRRAYRSGRGAEGPGARGTNRENGLGDDEDGEYFGQLLRRPGELPAYPRQPSRPRMRQPGRFPPPAGTYSPNGNPGGYPPDVNPPGGSPPRGNPTDRYPPDGNAAASGPPSGRGVSGGPVSGRPVSGGSVSGRPVSGGPVSGRPVSGGPVSGRPVSGGGYGGAVSGGARPGREYRLPNGRRVPPAADRPYRPPAPGPAGPVIRRRETAVPDERPAGAAQSVASIAPDGLESFARDLRALRAKAELDYPELAELSHYTMKTLASAAGGLRLPTLPVTVAYVRACGGNAAEWEDRWHKLAEKITASGAMKHRSENDEQQAPPEPADALGLVEPPALPTARDPDPGPGEVYLITSAKPREPGRPGGQGG